MDRLQERVRRFHQRFKVARTVDVYLLDLTSEVGELAKEYLRIIDYGEKTAASVQPSEAFAAELGDVLYSLLSLVDAAGLDAKALLEAALTKYEARISAKGSMGSSPES